MYFLERLFIVHSDTAEIPRFGPVRAGTVRLVQVIMFAGVRTEIAIRSLTVWNAYSDRLRHDFPALAVQVSFISLLARYGLMQDNQISDGVQSRYSELLIVLQCL